METKVTYRLKSKESVVCWTYDSLEALEKDRILKRHPSNYDIVKVTTTTTTEDITPPPKESTLDDLIESLEYMGNNIASIVFKNQKTKYIKCKNTGLFNAVFLDSLYNFQTGFYKSQRDAKIALVTEILLNGE